MTSHSDIPISPYVVEDALPPVQPDDPGYDAPYFLDGAPMGFQQYFWDALYYGKRTGRQAVDEFFGKSCVFAGNEEEERDDLGRYTDAAYNAYVDERPIPRR